MFRPVSWLGVSLIFAGLIFAGLCAVPALAGEAQAPQMDLKVSPARPAFSDIDTNKDGVVSQAEFDAFRPPAPDGDRQGPPPGGRRGHPPHGDGPHGPPPFAGRDLKRLDTDGDGKVSLEEFIAPAKARFSEMDTNKDGFLDENERKAPPPAE